MWGFAKKGRLNILLLKQKKAIRKVYNLKYRDHTHNYFIEGKILKLPDLIKHSTICYMQKGLHRFAHPHISRLWTVRQQEREDLRDQSVKLSFPVTGKQWINDLPPILHAKLWNEDTQPRNNEPEEFKRYSKQYFLSKYHMEEE